MLSNRIILSKNSVLTDLSNELKDPISGSSTINVVALQDYLFLGSDFPFTSRFFLPGVVNTSASVISGVDIWDGNAWIPSVEVMDETAVGGKTLAQSGHISWVPDNLKNWQRYPTNQGGLSITGLSSVTIYELYWARIKFSADLLGSTTLKYVGYRFANDEQLAAEYPDLIRSDVLSNFQTGKLNWNEQHIKAAEKIVDDMRSQGLIASGGQILDHNQFVHAGVHKVATMIFNAFGKPFVENKKAAIGEYNSALKKAVYNLDTNADGNLDISEMTEKQGFGTR